jgi:hypothetical protein
LRHQYFDHDLSIHICAHSGFCYDIGIECQAEGAAVYSKTGLNNPINDESHVGLPDAVGDNVDANVAQVLQTVKNQMPSYPQDPDGTMLLPWTMGDDFDFSAVGVNCFPG